MSSRDAALPPGSVRQSPEFGFSSSPLAWCVQTCALVALQAYQSTFVPLVVPAETTSRQPPWTRTVPSEYGDQVWPALPLQPPTNVGLPSVVGHSVTPSGWDRCGSALVVVRWMVTE